MGNTLLHRTREFDFFWPILRSLVFACEFVSLSQGARRLSTHRCKLQVLFKVTHVNACRHCEKEACALLYGVSRQSLRREMVSAAPISLAGQGLLLSPFALLPFTATRLFTTSIALISCDEFTGPKPFFILWLSKSLHVLSIGGKLNRRSSASLHKLIEKIIKTRTGLQDSILRSRIHIYINELY